MELGLDPGSLVPESVNSATSLFCFYYIAAHNVETLFRLQEAITSSSQPV